MVGIASACLPGQPLPETGCTARPRSFLYPNPAALRAEVQARAVRPIDLKDSAAVEEAVLVAVTEALGTAGIVRDHLKGHGGQPATNQPATRRACARPSTGSLRPLWCSSARAKTLNRAELQSA